MRPDSLVKRACLTRPMQVAGSLSTFNLHGQPAASFNGVSSFVQPHALPTFGRHSAALATVLICRDSGPPVTGQYLQKATLLTLSISAISLLVRHAPHEVPVHKIQSAVVTTVV